MRPHMLAESDHECDSSTDSESRARALDFATEAINDFFYDQWLEEEECFQALEDEASSLPASTLNTTHILANILVIVLVAGLAWVLH